MLNLHIIVTVNQKVLSLLAKFPDQEFYERQIARKIGIAYGSANRALNDLYSTGAIKWRQEGKMYFYSGDASKTAITELKKLINIMLIEPLVEELKSISSRIVLYGSCAQGIPHACGGEPRIPVIPDSALSYSKHLGPAYGTYTNSRHRHHQHI
jgi:DNA-binding transcriptional ArsR family regulator